MRDIYSKLSTNEDIYVRALVTDNATALTIVAETELKFATDNNIYAAPITINKKDQRDRFIPGLTYHTPVCSVDNIFS